MSYSIPKTRSHTGIVVLAAALLLVGMPSTPALAACGGDCNGDGEVTVDDIIVMVNFANGAGTIQQCPNGDSNADGTIAIDDIITAVNNALNGCPAVTPTATPTPTQTHGGGTPTPTRPIPAKCGDGNVDGTGTDPEYCDDGNNVEGPNDKCPVDCRIRPCTTNATSGKLNVQVSFTTPDNVSVVGVGVWLRYPENQVKLPGVGSTQNLYDRITSNVEDVAVFTPNDTEFALQIAFQVYDPSVDAMSPGLLFTAAFDSCNGATAPAAQDFTCVVYTAAVKGPTEIHGATCTVTLP